MVLGRRNSGSPEAIETLIGKNVKIEGKIIGGGSIRIDGQVEGHVSCQGDLIIGPTARVAAAVTARSVSVSGEVLGNITAERVELTRSAKVAGDVDCSELAIETGALYTGKTRMKKTEGAQARQPSPPETHDVVKTEDSGKDTG